MTDAKRIYVLDTNVLMHDPTALFRFEEHDVFLPMMVLEELDAAKKGMSEVSRNVRQASRLLNDLLEANGADKVATGLRLVRPQSLQLDVSRTPGRLLFQSHPGNGNGNGSQRFGTVLPDNQILAAILALREEHPGSEVILVSKDINLRIKAAIVGVVAEDYENDRALDDFSLLYTGATALPEDFWDRHERSEEHTSELQSLMRISYAVFCLKKQR